MHRALIKILVGLAVALGLTLTSAPVAQAAPGAVAERSSSAASSCAAEQAALAKAKSTHGRAVRAAKHARNALRKAKRAERKAETRKAKKAKHKVVVRTKKRLKKARARKATTARRVSVHNTRVARCRTTTQPGNPVTQTSQIQALCDAGVPQELCDVLAGLVPGGTAPLTTTFAQLCTATPQAQPLCDLLAGQAPDAAAFTALLTEIASGLGDPTQIESLLGSLLQQLGVADLFSLADLQSILDNVLDELAGILDPTDLGGLGDLVGGILDLLGLGSLLG